MRLSIRLGRHHSRERPPRRRDRTHVDELPDELDESGRGLWLAKATLDELDHERVGGRNTWRLVRMRSVAAGSAGEEHA